VPVNPIRLLLLITAFYLSSCGFQLNRNQFQLAANAESIALDRIDNLTYTPQLNLYLRQMLTDRFSQYGIPVKTLQTADLSLAFKITAADYVRQEYTYGEDGLDSYDFVFTVSGRMTVYNRNTQARLFDPPPLIEGRYSIKTVSQDLTQAEIEEGRRQALANLSDGMLAKLTQRF
jgi:outer membrane lipopolysaccharide assembly protein LptE/RlpB